MGQVTAYFCRVLNTMRRVFSQSKMPSAVAALKVLLLMLERHIMVRKHWQSDSYLIWDHLIKN